MFATLPIVFINNLIYLVKSTNNNNINSEQEALTEEKGKFVDLEITGIKFKSTRIKKIDGEIKTSSSEPKRQAP